MTAATSAEWVICSWKGHECGSSLNVVELDISCCIVPCRTLSSLACSVNVDVLAPFPCLIWTFCLRVARGAMNRPGRPNGSRGLGRSMVLEGGRAPER